MEIGWYVGEVLAGFPSPAEPWRERALSLNDLLAHPSATFFVRVRGNSMQGAGILEGDLLVVDRALSATHNSIIVAALGETFLVKRLLWQGERIFLKAEHPDYPLREVTADRHFQIWGVVILVLRGVHPSVSFTALMKRPGNERTR